MRAVPAAVGVLAVATFLVLPVPAQAGEVDACAQRVIRDWYSGGTVNGIYPLGCYRAALRALPEDVRQYSDANREIARALAYARRGLADPGPKGTPPKAPGSRPQAPSPAVRSESAAPSRKAERAAGAIAPTVETPIRLASGRDAVDGAGIPLPLIVLMTLALMLFAAAATAGLASHRRRRTDGTDR